MLKKILFGFVFIAFVFCELVTGNTGQADCISQ